MKKVWNAEIIDYIRKNIPGHHITEFVNQLNEHFGLNFTYHQLKNLCSREKIRCGVKSSTGLTPRTKIYTDEVINYMKSIAKGNSYKGVTEALNNKFGLNLTVEKIKSAMSRLKINTGTFGYFPKGNIPANKGKKMPPEVYKKCSKTMFKKGHIPQNHHQVGSERINVGGYIEIKIAEPSKWKLKHRLVWEKENGPIPPKHNIVFLDGNRQNCDIKNLACVSQSENQLMTRREYWNNNPELTQVGICAAKLESAIRKKD